MRQREGRHSDDAPMTAMSVGHNEQDPGRADGALTQLTVSVVICAYTEDRWDQLVDAVASVRSQSIPVADIVLVIDYSPELQARAARELDGVTVSANRYAKGLSGARNTGIAAASGDIVAFLDDDAAAAPDWLAVLLAPYSDPAVLGVGGRVVPDWRSGRPGWFPVEFDWVVGCSYRGLPSGRAPVRNFIGANMSLRRDVLLVSGGFATSLGRIGTQPLGCEETELCIRVQRDNPDGLHLYEPGALVRHRVPGSRATWSYFVSRCYSEGLSKATVSRLAGASRALAAEKSYLRSTIPRGIARYLVQAVRGQLRSLATMGALLVGVFVTAFGYAVGRVRAPAATATPNPGRFAKLRPPPFEPSERIAAFGLLVAVVLWLVSLPRIRLDRIGDYGLIPLLPATFWIAVAVLLVGFAAAVLRGENRTALLAAHPVVLIAILHATPSVRYETLRYCWAWKHIGMTDFFMHHAAVDRTIIELDAYQNWPGFFTFNAALVKGAGLHSALGYAAWVPPLVNLAMLAPLWLIFRSFTTDRRLIWSAVVIFILGSWVGQDYFAPQTFGYLTYLTLIALCLRYLAPGPRGDAVDRRRRAMIIATAVVLVAAVAPTHQLSPIMIIVALTALACCRYRVKVLLIAAIALGAGWDFTFAWPWIVEHHAEFTGSIGTLGHNAKSGFVNLSAVSPSMVVIAHIDRAHSAAVWAMGIVGFARRWRRHREPVIAALALAPLPMFVTNDYGSEMIFRVYEFTLPFVAFCAASLFFSRHTGAQRRLVRMALPVVLLALVPGFVAGYYGKEQANLFTRNEIDAARFVFGIAPRGSLIVGETGDFPWGFTNFEIYDYERIATLTPAKRRAIVNDPVGRLNDLMATHHHAYLVITRSQTFDTEMEGAFPRVVEHGSCASSLCRTQGMKHIQVALTTSPYFRVIYRNPEAMVITLAGPPQEAQR
jgi:Glycosyl transferase family 2